MRSSNPVCEREGSRDHDTAAIAGRIHIPDCIIDDGRILQNHLAADAITSTIFQSFHVQNSGALAASLSSSRLPPLHPGPVDRRRRFITIGVAIPFALVAVATMVEVIGILACLASSSCFSFRPAAHRARL
jgi:hypothetical protein